MKTISKILLTVLLAVSSTFAQVSLGSIEIGKPTNEMDKIITLFEQEMKLEIQFLDDGRVYSVQVSPYENGYYKAVTNQEIIDLKRIFEDYYDVVLTKSFDAAGIVHYDKSNNGFTFDVMVWEGVSSEVDYDAVRPNHFSFIISSRELLPIRLKELREKRRLEQKNH